MEYTELFIAADTSSVKLRETREGRHIVNIRMNVSSSGTVML